MIHVEQTFDPALVTRIATDPAVYPDLSAHGTAPADPAATYLFLPDTAFLVAWDGAELLGGFAVDRLSPVVCEGHFLLLPNGRGRRGLLAMREAALWIWAHTSCLRIVGKVSRHNPKSRRAAALAGMRYEFSSSDDRGEHDHLAVSVYDWILHHRSWLAPGGDMAAAMRGFVVALAVRGGIERAVGHYNEWARACDEPPLAVLGATPERNYLLREGQRRLLIRRDGSVTYVDGAG